MKTFLLLGLIVCSSNLFANEARVDVQVDRPGHPVSQRLWGIFFEDINLSADGGLYPELVRNRSFEDSEQPASWKLVTTPEGRSEIATDTSRPLNPLNGRCLRVRLDGDATLVNEGYFGMNVVKGEPYVLKLAARSEEWKGPLKVKVVAGEKVLAAGEISGIGGNWSYHSIPLTPTATDPNARLQLSFSGKGAVFLDMVSLLPAKTWKDHGLRIDLAESINALKPAFLRFPGGCWVEGENLSRMYNWKKTVGAIDVRTPLYNIWQYHATHGIGFHEYLQLAEDLGAEPLFCINVGMSHREVVPMDLMDQWVQDALDAIEYANGPTNTVWGGLRARNGHPAPFNLKYLEIGNENGHREYAERWPLFVQAIKAKHPEVQLIANHWAGSYPKTPMPEIVDEHYYNTPDWFMAHADQYDRYDRNGPKIFVGEYAVTRNTGQGNLRGAIGEAAFMTGLERNSDIVIMAAYAPLFCNANHKRWPINLINFDSSRWFGIPSYYVQKLFAEHRGDVTLPTVVEATMGEAPLPSGSIGVGTWNTSAEFKDIQVTAPDGKVLFTSDFTRNANGWRKLGGGKWSVEDGVLRQTAEREFVRAIAGDRRWTDYTLRLKARKISGREGFLILFHNSEDEDRTWWNLGGWGNSRHGIEMGETLDGKRGSIEAGRWYDIEVQVHGRRVRCLLDGKVIHEITHAASPRKNFFASATLDNKTGEVILKLVNSSATATEARISLGGVRTLNPSAQAIVLTSGSGLDENTLDQPTKVVPRAETWTISGPEFARTVPGNSLTVVRLRPGK